MKNSNTEQGFPFGKIYGRPPPPPPAQILVWGAGGPSTGRMGGRPGGPSLENEGGGLGGPQWKGVSEHGGYLL